MNVTAILAILSAGTAICTLHLVIGYWLGRQAAQPAGLGIGQLEALMRPQLTAARRVFEQAERVASAHGGVSPVPVELTESIGGLIDATRLLERQLNSLADSARRSAKRQLNRPSEPARSTEAASGRPLPPSQAAATQAQMYAPRLGLSEAELSAVTLAAGAPSALPATAGQARRYRFPAVKLFGACDGAFLPALRDMRPVQCHEICVDGISVFLDEEPEFERFAVNLGDGEAGPIMLCQILGKRAVYMYGRHGFIVDGRFTRRSSAVEADPPEDSFTPAEMALGAAVL
jgi:hypothetical protein